MTSKLKRYARNFSQSEDGTMTAFGLMMMFAMIIIGGVAFDLLRHEHVRTHLQNVADSSVLAAANMGNTQDPETVVRDYFKKAKLDRFLTEVDAPPGFLTKDVKAIAEASVNTSFMSFAGVPELDVKVLGQARQDAGDVEVAMVLDMSGSMLGQRETNLRTAANKFIDTIMPPDVTVPLEQTPSVSIVPYYDTVNFGPTFGPYWNLEGSRVPEEATAGSSMVSPYAGDVFSYCIRLEDEAFEDVEWDTSVDVERLGQYDSVTNHRNDSVPVADSKCPVDETNAVLMQSKNATTLKTHITNNLKADGPYGWTAISMGTKVGLAMLDDSTVSITNAAEAKGDLDAAVKDLPKPYVNDAGIRNVKVLVLMTDGENTLQEEMREDFKDGMSNVWFAPNLATESDNYQHLDAFVVWVPERGQWWDPAFNTWDAINPLVRYNIYPHYQLSNAELFATRTVKYVGHRIYDGNDERANGWDEFVAYDGSGNIYSAIEETYREADDLNTHTKALCDKAKDEDHQITIFTVAFDAPDGGKELMKYCASSSAHYYEVNGTEVVVAFEAIGRNINQLKLTQ